MIMTYLERLLKRNGAGLMDCVRVADSLGFSTSTGIAVYEDVHNFLSAHIGAVRYQKKAHGSLLFDIAMRLFKKHNFQLSTIHPWSPYLIP